MIKLIKSTFYRESSTKNKLIKFIKSADQLSFGRQCERFESNFSKYQQRKHTIFLNSGSSANLAIIQTLLNLGLLKKNDLVGFSAITWSTNVMSLIELGLTPVPIDVELNTLNISSNQLTKVLNRYPLKALFLTNLLGFCADLDKIQAICRQKKILLIEDNCESLGSIYKGKKLGNFGIASTFSFYVGHHLSTIEGGAICTDNDRIATMARIVRAHGWDRNLSTDGKNRIRSKHKINSSFYSRYTFYDLGFNFRPTEISGFLGNQQLRYINLITKIRQANFLKIADKLYSLTDKYYPIHFDHLDFISNFAFPLICKSKKIKEELVKKCNGKIEIRPIVAGDITEQPFFKKYQTLYSKTLAEPNAKLINDYGLYFGNNPELTEKEIALIIKIFS